MGSERTADFSCPRCGYDLSGMAASWVDRCPLTGRCSECGLELDHGRVMSATRRRIPWLYEHAPGRSLGLRRAWMTWQRCVLPWRFWKREGGVGLDTPPVAWRLWWWLPTVMISVFLISGLLRLAEQLEFLFIDPRGAALRAGYSPARWCTEIVNPFIGDFGYFWPPPRFRFYPRLNLAYPAKAWAACCIAAPLMVLGLSRTRAMVSVRRGHVLRAAVYGCALLVFWPLDLLAHSLIWLFARSHSLGSALGVGHRAELVLQFAGGLLGITWFGAWWYIVLVRVFILPNGRTVWAAVMLTCVLAAAIIALIDPGFAMFSMGWLI